MKTHFILSFIFMIESVHDVFGADCEISLRNRDGIPDNNRVQPLYIDPRTYSYWPTNTRMVVRDKEEVLFYCPYRLAAPFDRYGFEYSVIGTCVGGTTFTFKTKNIQDGKEEKGGRKDQKKPTTMTTTTPIPQIQKAFKEVTCLKNLGDYGFSAIPKPGTGTCTDTNSILLQAGYAGEILQPGRFLELMEICFNTTNENTLYVHHKLPRYFTFQDIPTSEQHFTASGFSGKTTATLDSVYKVENQKKVLTDRYFTLNHRLNRGHLAANSDFAMDSQKRASFLYLNVAPQWMEINSGNWKSLEKNVRSITYKNKYGALELYTGTYGVLTLAYESITKQHTKSVEQREIYLANSNKVPVPKLFFKVILKSEEERRGVVIIVVNNPHLDETKLTNGGYIICPDVIDQLTWLNEDLKKNKHDLKLGYLYACKVEDFIEKVKFLPNLHVTGLLS